MATKKKEILSEKSTHDTGTTSFFDKGLWWLLFLLAIAIMYGKTLQYGFVLDDDLFIRNNPTMQLGLSGIPETFKHGSQEHFKGSNFQMYRPVVISSFLWQYQWFELEPQGYHVINLLLYWFIAIVVFKILRRLLSHWHVLYPALITLLFIAHPIHSEVVANIKSQDELLAALFSLCTLLLVLKYDAEKKLMWLGLSLGCFFLALFSKESVVAFSAVLFCVYWLLLSNSFVAALRKTIPYFALALCYVMVRYAVLKDVPQGFETSAMENVLYAAHGVGEQVATRLAILATYFRLMVWPIQLSWDYSYSQIAVANWTSPAPYFALLWIALSVFGFIYFLKKQPLISFGIALFGIALAPVSNLFILNGTTLAERFLFLPSLGWILAVVMVLKWVMPIKDDVKPNYVFAASLAVLIGIGIMLSSNAASAWSSNFMLFETAVKHSPNSTRVNAGYATELMNLSQETSVKRVQDSLVTASISYFEKSIQLFPENYQAAYKLGMIEGMLGHTTREKELYLQSIRAHADNVIALNNLGTLYSKNNQADSAVFYFTESLKWQENNELTLKNIIIASMALQHYKEVIRYSDLFRTYGYHNEQVDNITAEAKRLNQGALTR